jgi:tripartite-type tricarboxylate transporter receptor subunit TctC
VDNRSNGVLAGDLVSKAAPDGYTLFVAAGDFWFGPLIQETPYDPVKDFLPITMLSQQVNVVVVHPSLPVKSVKDLIALAKARPGALNYGSGATGSSSHLSVELFKSMAGVDIVHVPFKSGSARIAALLSGEVPLTFSSPASVTPLVKAGRLRALAVTSSEPSELFPGLPPVAATGLPGYEYVGMTGVFAPAKTPETIINKLNQEIARALKRPETRAAFLRSGVEPVGSSPQQFAAKIKAEMASMSKVIKSAGIRPE